MGQHDRARPTLEPGHRVLGQYSGEHAAIHDPRPNPRMRRSISAEDDEARTTAVNEILARRWLLADSERLERIRERYGVLTMNDAVRWMGDMEERKLKAVKEAIG